ncbi:unnamed protein product [Oikopleura dioica]|uniref:Uncharacterized protein n=1 Tax=Oikopleura dioica TaxID=34765 RepID=E4YLV4_OIKDI|nr:unnamed protein product [Oikopleura dioica]
MEKLTQENAKIRLISERVPLLESKLSRAEKNAVDAEQLEKRLQASIEDRNIFEERYLRSVESVKEAQSEIDARQQLVIDMHKQSQTFQRAANNVQKEKTAALVELENMRIELELVRQNSLPENLSHFAKVKIYNKIINLFFTRNYLKWKLQMRKKKCAFEKSCKAKTRQ